MRKLIVRVADYSLDGIIGVEDTEFFTFCRDLPDDSAHEASTLCLLEQAELHIMGRNTYEGMAQYYPTATDHPYAEVMNKASKAVFSSTLTTADWPGTTIVSGDTRAEIEKLKQLGSGDIIAHGGVSFVRSLTQLDLADAYFLTVFPYVAGSGKRLFEHKDTVRELEFASATAFANGIVELVYRRRR
jgi:dihydrofolate reductase